MTDKTKKTIAREGLIIVSIGIIMLGILPLGVKYPDSVIFATIWFLLLFSYPLLWIGRFVIWAIKTLRKE